MLSTTTLEFGPYRIEPYDTSGDPDPCMSRIIRNFKVGFWVSTHARRIITISMRKTNILGATTLNTIVAALSSTINISGFGQSSSNLAWITNTGGYVIPRDTGDPNIAGEFLSTSPSTFNTYINTITGSFTFRI